MSKFKVEFTLKQHTPIIHFQSEQSGATLRATELKPKLDKFLLNKFLLDNVENIPYIENANGHKSLDYKVTIEPNISQRKEIDDKNPLFFGNMKPKDISEQEWQKLKKRFKEYTKSFKIEFFSFKPQIIEVLKEYFEAFLANTNFGTRQSKGFGSFYIANKKFNKSLIPYKVYSFSSKHWETDIGLLYQFLRQGINLTKRTSSPFYTKPAIFAYAKSKGWQWDKKSIKEEYFDYKLQSQIEEYNSNILIYSSKNKYLLRDLFGLSSSQEWKSYGKTIEKTHENIERFKSPITFKIVDDKVYFWVNESYKQILNQKFNIKAGNGNTSLNLSTPKEFDFDEFFDFAFSIDLDNHINNDFHNTKEFKSLKSILNLIRAK